MIMKSLKEKEGKQKLGQEKSQINANVLVVYHCGQLGLNSIGWISEKLTSELSCQAMGTSDIGVQTLHWAEAHSVHIPVPLTSLLEITIWGALRRLKGNWDKASEGLLVLG